MLASLLLGFVAAAAADEAVYRYVDAEGVVHYTDRAPDKHARPIRLAPLSGVSPGAGAGKRTVFYSPEALRQAARFAVRVESPTPDQRLPAKAAPLVAAASVMPALVSGFRLVYQVDGRSVTAAPVDALSIPLQPLPAGTHELQIILLDDHGRELARSEASRFRVAPLKLAAGAPIKG
ncbi:DUF4124 domain-containing protein [Solimonas soli]|uniref:DUF4124 domain-containing protein n=1 Tax=Solimonas soli TaxID=413479 RepID=UPI000480FF83|nr:DUF4124 domain-containing protein [Solimonas soli]